MTLDDLDIKYGLQKYRVVLRSIPDAIYVDLYNFIWYGYSVGQSQALQIVKDFDFEMTCDVIGDPEVKYFDFAKALPRSIEHHLNFVIISSST